MVLVDMRSNPKAAIEFTAEINLIEEKSTKAILWEGYEPTIISQTTNQACAIDFSHVQAEEIKEEDLQKLKDFTDGLTTKRPKNRLKINEDELPILKLGKQKSKSQDFKQISSLKEMEQEESNKTPERRQSSFSRRKIANVFLCTNMTVNSSRQDRGDDCCDDVAQKDCVKSSIKNRIKSPSSPLSQLFEEVDQKSAKMSMKEKIKNIKKSIYMYAEDFAPRKKRKIRFITIKPNECKVLKFKFKYHPEYMTKGQKIIINDSSMKAVGTIIDIVYTGLQT